MFGILRTVLALQVAISHLVLTGHLIGAYAVFGFYVISGYLMTLIMHEIYGFDPVGRQRFALNRVLRLLPPYWIAALTSILIISFLGEEEVRTFHWIYGIPKAPVEILANALMIYPQAVPAFYVPKLISITWTITVEVTFYLAICFGISRTLGRVWVWFVLSAIYVPITYALDLSDAYRYFAILAGSLPFSIGAMIYFLSRRPKKIKLPTKPLFWLMLVFAWATSIGINSDYWPVPDIWGYVNLTICALLVYSMAVGGSTTSLSPAADKAIGDYSYPIYLFHQPFWILFSMLLAVDHRVAWNAATGAAAALAMAATILASWAVIAAVDRPVHRLREKIKAPAPLRHHTH